MPPSIETVATVHVDQLLSNLARLYRPDPDAFIADQLVPYIGVTNESDIYPVFTQGDFYGTDVDDLVPDRTEPRVVDVSHSTERYETQRRELAWDISDRERGNADNQLNLERNKQSAVLSRLSLKREIRVAALLRKTTNGGKITSGAAAAAVWNSATLAQMQADVFTGREALRQTIGVRANVIVIPEAVASAMSANSNLATLLQYTYGNASERPLLEEYFPTLPAVLWGMRVMTPGLIKNTAKEGQTESYSDVWGKSIRMLYVTGAPATENPSIAYTFRSEPFSTRTDRNGRTRVDWYATGQTIDERVVAPGAGYEIDTAAT
jgi:hypothetical protein